MTEISPLDNPQIYSTLDPSGMWKRIADLSNQCSRAWKEACAFALPQAYRQVGDLVTLGMGGSGVGGNLLADLAATEENTLPVTMRQDYTLPPDMGPRTLVLAASYSGNTEETLSAFEEAIRLGTKIVAVTTGGQLAQRCQELDIPSFIIGYKGEPRTALGYSFVVPLALLCNLGLLPNQTIALEEAIALLESKAMAYAPTVPLIKNPAKALAHEMMGRLVIIYGAGVLEGAARRWKTQVNENAKAWAFSESLPELNHNAVAGYTHPSATAKATFVVLLRPVTLHPRTALRFEITTDILRSAEVAHHIIQAEGKSSLAQILSTAYLGDYASYYLALLYGVDPSSVPTIDKLKRRLAVSQ